MRILVSFCLALLCGFASAGVLDKLEELGSPIKLESAREFLPADEAFRLTAEVNAAGEPVVRFEIEPGYYLYRDKLALSATTPGVAFAAADWPAGEWKEDPEFGRVEVYKHALSVALPLKASSAAAQFIEAQIKYQGCAEDGICYPPMKKTLGFQLTDGAAANTTRAAGAAPGQATSSGAGVALSASDRITSRLASQPLGVILASFFGFGLLLALTPCVLPMVPILSGIIVGQKQPVGTARALVLSATYVIAMALTYTVAGVIAGLAGRNLQAAFQHPVAIASFAAVFVALALSMFGFYELQLPAGLQSRLDAFSRKQRGGSLLGVAVMGVLSAIIVGPCVAPPLAGALAYIGQTGSPYVGGAALFALGLGMGVPLLAVGTSAGALLPRAGAWMERVKQVFGVVFLGVAIWFLERIVPAPLVLLLWGALALGCAVFLGALVRFDQTSSPAARLGQAAGLVLLVYGTSLIVGAAAGGSNPLSPLRPFAGGANGVAAPALPFQAVSNTGELEQVLRTANGSTVMLDFYADWCVECKHLEQQTFTHPEVHQRLSELTLVRADVTANNAADQALLERFGLYGPPAILFFRDGEELRAERLIGFADAGDFSALLDTINANP